jgi:hypothetical protein
MKIQQLCKLAAVVLFLITTSCNHKKDSPPPRTAKDHALEDLQGLTALKGASMEVYGKSYNDVFARIFGGLQGVDVKRYTDQRLKRFYTQADLKAASVSPSTADYSAFEMPDPEPREGDNEIVTAASNLGTGLYYVGLMNDVTLKVSIAGSDIDITSPRVGLMQIGEGYMMTATDSSGNRIDYPQLSRMATLVHEARHSDCAEVPSQTDVGILRDSQNYRETMKNYHRFDCGFMHALCEFGDYKDYAACDEVTWGAYAVDAIFIQGEIDNTTGLEREIMEIILGDTVSRLNYSYTDLLKGKLGQPDMSSVGEKN